MHEEDGIRFDARQRAVGFHHHPIAMIPGYHISTGDVYASVQRRSTCQTTHHNRLRDVFRATDDDVRATLFKHILHHPLYTTRPAQHWARSKGRRCCTQWRASS